MSDTAKDIAQKTLSKRAQKLRTDRKRRLTALRVGVVVCFFLVLLLFLAALQIGRIPVRSVTFEGNAHYDSHELQALLDINIGDSLYGFDPEKAADALLAACPYLKQADLSVSITGEVKVFLRERVALWALLCEEQEPANTKYLLLDEQLVALEYASSPMDLCTVSYGGLALPEVGQTLTAAAKQAQKEYDAWLKAQKDKPDEPSPAYVKRAEYLADKLTSLASCYADMTATDAPASLDLMNDYDRVLVLRDGTQYLLGRAENIPEQLSRASLALSQYRSEQGQISAEMTLTVDLSDSGYVLITQNHHKE